MFNGKNINIENIAKMALDVLNDVDPEVLKNGGVIKVSVDIDEGINNLEELDYEQLVMDGFSGFEGLDETEIFCCCPECLSDGDLDNNYDGVIDNLAETSSLINELNSRIEYIQGVKSELVGKQSDIVRYIEWFDRQAAEIGDMVSSMEEIKDDALRKLGCQ